MKSKIKIVVIIMMILVCAFAVTAQEGALVVDLDSGSTVQVNCSGELAIVLQTTSQIEAECRGASTATPIPSSEELLSNWQLYNAIDGQGNLWCEPKTRRTAPFWEAHYWVFRGPWNEDPDPDQCVTRTQGEQYPDNSVQTNHIPVGETGTLWQVAEAPTPYSNIMLSSVYAQHESGEVHWSLWACPNAQASVAECTLIYRTDPTMRIPPLNTKECSAYEMTLEVATAGNVTWNAEKVLASCPGDPIATITDTTASFSPNAYIGVLHEVTPRSDGAGMSGVKIANIKLSVGG